MPLFENLPSTRQLSQVIQKSPFEDLQSDEQQQAIIKAFNQQRKSIMIHSLPWIFRHRQLMPNQYRLVEHNNIPELVPYTETPLRRIKKPFDAAYKSSTLGVYQQSELYIGAYGHHLLNIPNGSYAKVMINNQAVLLGQGQHVIQATNFSFNIQSSLVKETEPYICHQDLHILRVPPGKLAAVTIDNHCFILESREQPYVFQTQQFKLSQPSKDKLFYEASQKYIEFGNIKRILPDLGEVAVINHGAHLDIKSTAIITTERNDTEPPQADLEAQPLLLEKASARFVGFLPTNIQNLEFPSDTSRAKRIAQGITAQEAAFDTFYTQDSVKVGVKFFVCYRIDNPSKTLEHLDLDKIQEHIEGVVNLDMGRAIQKTSIQNLLSSNTTKPQAQDKENEALAGQEQYWQDTVKSQLSQDLASYGIELIRLNIEEARILNVEIENQMSEQAITVARAMAEKAALTTVTQVARQKAEQEQQLRIANQQANNQIATLEADAKLQVANKEAQGIEIRGKALSENKEVLQLEFAKIMAEALQGANLSSTLPLSDFFNQFSAIATGTNQHTFFAHQKAPIDGQVAPNNEQQKAITSNI